MSDQAERWHVTEAIFHEAVQAGEPERTAILTARCAGDTALMAELRSLLAACSAEESHRLGVDPDSLTAGAAVGPYVIDGLVGRGGMGAVYRAHRSDGQFEQQVAIKIVDMPLASDYFRERFRAERQMLASLSHPYIARLLDGGMTPDGELYLAMEYIDGICITDFCSRHELTIADRVPLFLKVCEAVQYAHRNLIVHRDLKPENILVAPDHTPRLLDFGTARIIQPLSAERGDNATRAGLQAFTPRYASPEQVLGQPISIASDIYSLGVLLYVLLTGAAPYELTDYTTEELIRVICHQQPQRPGAVTSSIGQLDADLDAIVLMALRKEPADRYSTVEQMATDLRAWLDRRPVLARRGNLRYRTGRFIRRNRLAVAGAALLLATAMLGTAGIAWQAHVAQVERRRAQAHAEDLRELSISLLTELDEAIKQLPGSTSAQKLLVMRVLEHLDRMSANTTPDKPTALNLADAYTRVANLEGNPYDQNIGDSVGALASVGKAVALTAQWKQLDPNSAETLHAFAFARQSQSEIFASVKRLPEAVVAMREAAAAYAALAARPDATALQMSDASSAYGSLGDELGMPGKESLGDGPAALAAYRTAIAYQHKALTLDPGWPRARRTYPVALMKIGNMELATDPWEAMRQFQAGLLAMKDYPAAEKNSIACKRLTSFLQRRLSTAFLELELYPQAIAAITPAPATAQEEVNADSLDVRSRIDLVVALDNEAVIYEGLVADSAYRSELKANRQKALSLLERMLQVYLDIVRRSPEDVNDRENLAHARVRLGTMQQGTAQATQGAQLSAQGLADLERIASQTPPTSFLDSILATSLLTVEPASLRNAGRALMYAERAADAAPQRPLNWAHLAQARRAAGVPVAERQQAALKGLALLAPVRPGESSGTTRKELEAEAR